MNTTDIILLLIIGISVVLAVKTCIKSRRNGGCCGNCNNCSGCRK